MPDFSDLPTPVCDWNYSVYGNVQEMMPEDIPTPLGKEVMTVTYVDANLYHDKVTGRSVTSILHMLNQTPIEWYSKRQATVETATYGSEFSAARTAVEQILDLRVTLRYLGVPVVEKSYMFGDNKSVVQSSAVPQSLLNKRHCALSYHRVREAIASGVIEFHWIDGPSNPADVLTKHNGYVQAWPLLKPMLFWGGDTMDLLDDRIQTHGESQQSEVVGGVKPKTPMKPASQYEAKADGWAAPRAVVHVCKRGPVT